MVVFTTKPIVPLNFCYKPACVKWIRLKYDNKSDLLFFAKPSKSVSLSKTIFFLNPEAYSDQWTDWSDTFFFIKVGAKTKKCWASPIFTPLPLRRLWPEHLSQAAHPISSAYITLSCASQHFSSVNFRHCMRHTMDNFQQSFYFHLPCHPIHDPISTTCVSPFLAGSVK